MRRPFAQAGTSPDPTDYHDHKTPAPVGAMHPSPAAQSIAAARPHDTIRRSSHERHRPSGPGCRPPQKNSTRPLPGRGGDQGEGRPHVRPALPRIANICVRSSKKPSIGPPDGQGIFGIHIVAVYFTYAIATTAAPCPADALPLRFSYHRRCRRMPFVGATHQTTNVRRQGQNQPVFCRHVGGTRDTSPVRSGQHIARSHGLPRP